MTSLLIVQHQPDSGPGALEVPLRRAGFELDFWFPPEAPRPSLDGIAGIVSLGGLAAPEDTTEEPWLEDERALIREALVGGTPFLGVCLGAQLLALEGGGSVERASEHGWTWIDPGTTDDDPVLEALAPPCEVFQWHDWAFRAPSGACMLATSDTAQQAFRLGDRAWGVQFHLELTLAIAAEWMVVSRDTLVEHGVDPDALRAETAERESEWCARAARVAARFADVCRAVRAS
jgi:GMP synthase (glutamine-hydrolysing)